MMSHPENFAEFAESESLPYSRQGPANGVTPIIKPDSHIRTTEPFIHRSSPVLLPYPFTPTCFYFHYNHDLLVEDFCHAGHPSKIWRPHGYIHISFASFTYTPVVLFAVRYLGFSDHKP